VARRHLLRGLFGVVPLRRRRLNRGLFGVVSRLRRRRLLRGLLRVVPRLRRRCLNGGLFGVVSRLRRRLNGSLRCGRPAVDADPQGLPLSDRRGRRLDLGPPIVRSLPAPPQPTSRSGQSRQNGRLVARRGNCRPTAASPATPAQSAVAEQSRPGQAVEPLRP